MIRTDYFVRRNDFRNPVEELVPVPTSAGQLAPVMVVALLALLHGESRNQVEEVN